ncbi:hypothetical protein [Pedobacter gandavensis]|uniref:hypothetical protein n=1 Tax=Pedobacter gandavensis TaxID=2679963 RepID=UPI00292E982D|nr:hypothetical protein [Pedobacter gandavensis]
MKIAQNARKLVNYINSLKTFETFYMDEQFCYNHIGALLVDITLQAGLNYNTVVKPRVQRVLLNYPEANTVNKFQDLINELGLEKIIKWKNDIKLNRLKGIIDFAIRNNINTCVDFKIYLIQEKNRKNFLELNGVGPKTVDYTLKLLNVDTVAVDRHIYSFVELAEIPTTDYHVTKKVVEYAADFLEVPRSSMDYSIWHYMSQNDRSQDKNSKLQLELELI